MEDVKITLLFVSAPDYLHAACRALIDLNDHIEPFDSASAQHVVQQARICMNSNERIVRSERVASVVRACHRASPRGMTEPMDANTIEHFDIYALISVSYTHLTLPTNREV